MQGATVARGRTTVQGRADRELMRLAPAPLRRAAIAGVPFAVGVWAGWTVFDGGGLAAGPALAVAAVALAAAFRLWRATGSPLTLTDAALTDGRGRVVARITDIRTVERGALSLAPAGGFVLRLSRPAAARWTPGLWWRVGTRVGVGGSTPRLRTREMGLLIEAMIAVRQRRG